MDTKPRYHLTTPDGPVNGSWWVDAPRDRFTYYALEREWPRMRSSKFGGLGAPLAVGPSELNAVDAYKAQKRSRAHVAQWDLVPQ